MREIERNQYTYRFTSHGIIIAWYSRAESSKAGIEFVMLWHAQRKELSAVETKLEAVRGSGN